MEEQIKQRTKQLAIDIINFCSSLPNKQEYWIISKQLIKSSTSIGANYRAATRAKSVPDFVNKLAIVEEETDETIYWLELLEELGIRDEKIEKLKKESNEILSIIVASIKTIKNKISKK